MQHSISVEGIKRTSAEWKSERLDSWKEVASYFDREVRTVQLWEKSEGLPVRRQYHKKLGSVYAYRRELEEWWIVRSAISSGYGPALSPIVTPPKKRSANVYAEPPDTGYSRILALPFEVSPTALDRGVLRQTVMHFGGGLKDDLILELGRLRFQPICVASSVLPTPGAATPAFLRNLAKQFRADLFLTGSIRYSGNQLRVSVQLIAGEGLTCLWSDRFDVGIADIVTAQAELALGISQALAAQHCSRPTSFIQQPMADHGPAYHAKSMGLHFWNQRSKTALTKAAGYFEDAIALDPNCVDAYAGLADTYVSLSYNHIMSARLAAECATEAVDAALKLDPKSLSVRNALISVLMYCTWDLVGAERGCQELLGSGDVVMRTLQLYSSLMNSTGRHHEAISLALHAHRLDPLSDLANGQVALAYFYAGDYDNALSFTRRTICLQPQYVMGYALLGRTEAERGNWNEAVNAFQQGLAMSSHSPFFMALLAYAYAGSGDTPRALEILRDLEAEDLGECFPAYDVSAVHAILKQEEEALRNISRAYDARDMKMIYMQHDPRFAGLRASSAFQEIAARVHTSY